MLTIQAQLYLLVLERLILAITVSQVKNELSASHTAFVLFNRKCAVFIFRRDHYFL